MNKKGHRLKSNTIVFLEDHPTIISIVKGDEFLESYDNPEDEFDKEHYHFLDYEDDPQVVKRSDEGTLYEVLYHETRANWLDKEYTPRPMNEYRLTRKREHAKSDPSGRTTELMGHIDWLMCRMEKMYDMINSLPVSIEDLVDFSECPSDDED